MQTVSSTAKRHSQCPCHAISLIYTEKEGQQDFTTTSDSSSTLSTHAELQMPLEAKRREFVSIVIDVLCYEFS